MFIKRTRKTDFASRKRAAQQERPYEKMNLKQYLQPIFKTLKFIIMTTSLFVLFDSHQNTLRLTFYKISLYPPDTEKVPSLKARIQDLVPSMFLVIGLFLAFSAQSKWKLHELEKKNLIEQSREYQIMGKVLVSEIDRILKSNEKLHLSEMTLRKRRSYTVASKPSNVVVLPNPSDSSDIESCTN